MRIPVAILIFCFAGISISCEEKNNTPVKSYRIVISEMWDFGGADYRFTPDSVVISKTKGALTEQLHYARKTEAAEADRIRATLGTFGQHDLVYGHPVSNADGYPDFDFDITADTSHIKAQVYLQREEHLLRLVDSLNKSLPDEQKIDYNEAYLKQ